MGLRTRRRRLAAVAIAAVAVLTAAAACGSGDSGKSKNGTITLTVDIFGDQGFGYDDLYSQYTQSHSNIKIQERGKGLGLGDYNTRLTQWMTSGNGAGDIVALEEGTIVQFKAQATNFVNLADYGANSMESEFLPWKWKQGQSSDGKQLIGLGTDVGSLAMCYRKDLFQKAGLPTDRQQVSALWQSWDGYLDTGKKFGAANTGAKFVDAATNLYNAVLMQAAGNGTGYTYYDTSNKLVIGSNPDIKTAWDVTVKMIQGGLSANLHSFSPEWTQGFKQAQFATIACPAWMTGVIKGQAGDEASGKWDVATAPGAGGNWGGSFLAVPKQSKHPKEAAELAKFLTGREGQIAAWKKLGNLPSNPKALEDSSVVDAKNAYFSDAPTGKIFGTGAKDFKPVYLGPKNQAVRDAVENALRSIEQGQRKPDEAWQDAVKNGDQAGK
jgi:cellobiose transport system substrate-binding protein